MKTCSKCNRSFPLEMFRKSDRYDDGRTQPCKECVQKNRLDGLARNLLCARCKLKPHTIGHPYCPECKKDSKRRSLIGDVRVPKQKDTLCIRCRTNQRESDRLLCKTCDGVCPKCNTNPRAMGAVWCLPCLRVYQKEKRKKDAGAWYKKLTPEQKNKRKRRASVWGKISRGKMTPKPCEICGSLKTEADHYKGYDKENTFVVRWLCRLHHRAYEKWTRKVLTKDLKRIDGRAVTPSMGA